MPLAIGDLDDLGLDGCVFCICLCRVEGDADRAVIDAAAIILHCQKTADRRRRNVRWQTQAVGGFVACFFVAVNGDDGRCAARWTV